MDWSSILTGAVPGWLLMLLSMASAIVAGHFTTKLKIIGIYKDTIDAKDELLKTRDQTIADKDKELSAVRTEGTKLAQQLATRPETSELAGSIQDLVKEFREERKNSTKQQAAQNRQILAAVNGVAALLKQLSGPIQEDAQKFRSMSQ